MVGLAGATGIDNSGLVKDATTASFRADVIAESARQPVLVDFWAPWCGPCKQLAPVLEKVVRAAKGKVKLVKMNIDEHPEIAQHLGVRSIPAVFAFERGQPADGFMGALPEGQIKAFVERLVGPLSASSEELRGLAEAALAQGETESAAALFQQILSESPDDLEAVGGLVRTLVAAGQLDDAEAQLQALPPKANANVAISAARAALELASLSKEAGDEAQLRRRLAEDQNDHDARLNLAIVLSAHGDREGAADALLDVIRRERRWNDDAARKQLLQFFEAWGPMATETINARRKLSALLFS
jgi:putative thioredoxin